MTKVAVILSGCGVYDGSEIVETTITLLELSRAGVEVQCMAPNIEQMHVINHLTGDEMKQTRNVLVESARLARGNVVDIGEASPEDFDAVIIPGGYGAAKNLSNFATQGGAMKINDKVASFVRAIHRARKPVGLMCIASAMAPKLFGEGVQCTVGNDEGTSAAINAMGGVHLECGVTEIVVDEKKRIVTTPAYMLGEKMSDVAEGIEKLVNQVLYLTR